MRFASHVGEEVLEVFPAAADANAAPAVVLPLFPARAYTAGEHGSPAVVLRREPSPPCITVRKVHDTYDLGIQATATLRTFLEKIAGVNDPSLPAIAAASPFRFTFFAGSAAKNHEAIKSVVC